MRLCRTSGSAYIRRFGQRTPGKVLSSYHFGEQIGNQRSCVHPISAKKNRPLLETLEDGLDKEPSSFFQGEDHTVRASKALRSRMTSVGPSWRINCFLLRSLKRRVTVSRDAPMRCAISSWVMEERIRDSTSSAISACDCDSNSRASLPAEERLSTRSWMSR